MHLTLVNFQKKNKKSLLFFVELDIPKSFKSNLFLIRRKIAKFFSFFKNYKCQMQKPTEYDIMVALNYFINLKKKKFFVAIFCRIKNKLLLNDLGMSISTKNSNFFVVEKLQVSNAKVRNFFSKKKVGLK